MAVNRGSGRLLADWTITALQAEAPVLAPTAGSTTGNSVISVTPNSIGSTTPNNGIVWDALLLRIHPGVPAAGVTPPDLSFYPVIDGQPYSSWFYADMSVQGLMFPRREQTVGQKVVKLGASLLRAANEAATVRLRNPAVAVHFPANMPIRYTGWKVTDTLQLMFYSAAGFTASAWAVPPRVQIFGDVYDEGLLSQVAAQLDWRNDIFATSPRRIRRGLAAFKGTFSPPAFTLKGWRALPGGVQQGAVTVQRSFRYAVNAQPVSGTIPYVLSTIQSLGGTQQNVAQNQDIGWDYSKVDAAFVLMEFGRRPGQGAGYWGLYWGNNEIEPLDTSFGQPLSYGDNPIPFGLVQPNRPDAGLYYAMPSWHAWEPSHEGYEVIYKETVAPFILPQGGQTIAAGTDETAYGGVVIMLTNAAQ